MNRSDSEPTHDMKELKLWKIANIFYAAGHVIPNWTFQYSNTKISFDTNRFDHWATANCFALPIPVLAQFCHAGSVCRGLLKYYKDRERDETNLLNQPLCAQATEEHNSTDVAIAQPVDSNDVIPIHRSEADIEILRKADTIKNQMKSLFALGALGAIAFTFVYDPYPKNCSKLFKAYLGFNNGVDAGNVMWLLIKICDCLITNILKCYDRCNGSSSQRNHHPYSPV